MSKLYLRLPSNTAAESVTNPRALACRYALVAAGRVEREGIAALSELSATLTKVDRVTLLLAASDVTLLRLRVPPLSATRLKAALPNLAEEHLMSDPAECVIVAGPPAAGMRTIAVVQRAWLETIVQTIAAEGVRSMRAVPAQACLAFRPGMVSATVDQRSEEVEVTVRLSEHEGIGVAMPAGSSPRDVLDTLGAVARDAPLTLYVPEASVDAYRGAIEAMPEIARRVTLAREDWSCWLDGAESTGLDLVAGLGGRYAGSDRWRQWRWPMALAAGLVVVNLVGLYSDWWRMKSEEDQLRAGMIQTFKSAYPKDTVIVDPIAQTKQKIEAARRAAGQPDADDFLVLLSRFGETWTLASQARPGRKVPQIAAVEYRDHSLLVRPQADAEVPEDALAADLKKRGLSFSQDTSGTWKIGNIK